MNFLWSPGDETVLVTRDFSDRSGSGLRPPRHYVCEVDPTFNTVIKAVIKEGYR